MVKDIIVINIKNERKKEFDMFKLVQCFRGRRMDSHISHVVLFLYGIYSIYAYFVRLSVSLRHSLLEQLSSLWLDIDSDIS